MSTTSNYSWLVYGAGGPTNPVCLIHAYRTDNDRNPSQWQETLQPGQAEYAQAVAIISRDRAQALASGNFEQSVINAQEAWFYRRAPTGNGWECVLDANGNEEPNPCLQLTPGDARDRSYTLANVKIVEKFRDNKVTITIAGNLPMA